MVLFTWLFGGDEGALAFSEAEIQFLFPAPLSRRQLVHYKLLRSLLLALIAALILTLSLGRRMTGSPALFALGAWLGVATVSLHGVAASLTRLSLLEHGVRGPLRRAVALLVPAAILGSLAVGVLRAPWRHPLCRGRALRGAPPRRAAPLLGGDAPRSRRPRRARAGARRVSWGGCHRGRRPRRALPVGALHRRRVRAGLDRRRRAPQQAPRRDAPRAAPRPRRRSPSLPARAPRAPGVRHLLEEPHRRRAPLLAAGDGGPPPAGRRRRRGRALGRAAEPAWAPSSRACSLAPPRSGSSECRSTGSTSASTSTTSISSAATRSAAVDLALAEVLAPFTVLTLGSGSSSSRPPCWRRPTSSRAQGRVALLPAAMVALPAFTLCGLIVQNAAALLFPAWVESGSGPPRGVEAIGQRLLTLVGTMVAVTVGLIPAVVVAAGGVAAARAARRRGAAGGGARGDGGGGAAGGVRLAGAGEGVRPVRPGHVRPGEVSWCPC